jgi:hypothetical protein
MCKAIAKAPAISPKPDVPGGRSAGSVRPALMASSICPSEPEMLRTPSTYSAMSLVVELLQPAGPAYPLMIRHPSNTPRVRFIDDYLPDCH